MKVPRLALLAAVVALGTPALAQAQHAAPPGNSAVDQYRESAPTGGASSRKLSRKERSQLQDEGRDGAALVAALEGTGGMPEHAGGDAPSTPDARGRDGGGSGAAATAHEGTAADTRRGETHSTGRAGDDGRVAASDRPDGDAVAARSGDAAAPKADSAVRTSASVTVGPFPIWSLLVAAVLIAGVAAVLRGRRAA
ncbi:hypothetical protein [Patulibacter sp. SYSU D01012]|uniref:hypothetical protein n=1 Tax=Patulibacter sp. SYSU D01012 TaxID=2817381 RepID=UPI001B311F41|nr:hypothetical protein [Patulibacter sp. SYSU D01012]